MGDEKLWIAITGEESFARRHRLLFDAIAERGNYLHYVTSDRRTRKQRREILTSEIAFACERVVSQRSRFPLGVDSLRQLRRDFLRSPASFKTKSMQTEHNLNLLPAAPDAVLHIFGLYRPYWTQTAVPFMHYLDYTASLQQRAWMPNGSRQNGKDLERWLAVEQETYHRAAHLFPMSDLVRSSLIQDYGVDSKKITVVGSGGKFVRTNEKTKPIGSQQILFNANPFTRKGGDIALAAFELVRLRLPKASLVVVGTSIGSVPPGVVNTGFISSPTTMEMLFEQSDVVIAPARQDPFPGFLIEAMSHGVPCIASAVDGVPEIVDDGVNGTVVSLPTPATLAEAIVELLCDRTRLQMYSDASLVKASERFDWSVIAHKVVTEIEPALSLPR